MFVYISHPASPNVIILHNHDTTIKNRKLPLIQYYQLNYNPFFSNFSNFPTIIHSLFKSFLMRVNEESEKAGLKLSIQNAKIMASGPITLWQIGKKVQVVTSFLFLGSKIIVEGDCSHGIKRHLFLGKKCLTNLYSILKSTDITLPTKVHIVKAMVFPIVMYGCESWTIKKAEHQELMFLSCGPG